MRLYSDLANVQPASAEWKDDLKTATRHFRLLAMYVPSDYLKTQDSEEKAGRAAQKLLHDVHLLTADEEKAYAANSATTKPAESAASTDWHETLAGIKMETLRDSLEEAKANYFRPVSFKTLAVGGLNGVEVVLISMKLSLATPSPAWLMRPSDSSLSRLLMMILPKPKLPIRSPSMMCFFSLPGFDRQSEFADGEIAGGSSGL